MPKKTENLPSTKVNQTGLDGKPYDKTACIERARMYVKKSVEDIIEAGKALLILREAEGHGEFVKICEDNIGMPHTTAYRFMNSALLAMKHPGIDFSHVGKITKVYALLEAPDEDLKALEEKGYLAGHDMEDLAMMSHKELRELITNLRQNHDPEKEKLKKEIKDLKKHNANLQARIPERPDSDWAQDYIAELEHQFESTEELLRVFMLDERMLEPDREQVHAAAEAMFQRLNARLDSLRTKWHQFTGQNGRAA